MFQAQIPVQAGTFPQLFSDGYPGIINNSLINLYYYQQNTNYITVVVRNISNYCPTYANDTIHILFTPPVDSIQNPVVNGNYIAIGDTVPHVQWYLNGYAIAWVNSDTLFMDSIGCYSYEAWNLDRDCSVMSTEYCQTVTSTMLKLNNRLFRIFPNPNNGNFIIVSTDEKIANPTIFITDIAGRNIPFELIILDEHTFQINAEPLASGIYNLSLNGEKLKLLCY